MWGRVVELVKVVGIFMLIMLIFFLPVIIVEFLK